MLIHADPGARSGFVAAWLQDRLTEPWFDVGESVKAPFFKIHRLVGPMPQITPKIRIRPTTVKLDLHTLLFLYKNVYTLEPDFTRDEYSIETMAKIWNFIKEIFEWDSLLRYDAYDHVVDFESTFDTDAMIQLYKSVNLREPNDTLIQTLIETNNLNNIEVLPNHTCGLCKLIWSKEHDAGFKEADRYWSIVDVYQNVPINDRYNTIDQLIQQKNYKV